MLVTIFLEKRVFRPDYFLDPSKIWIKQIYLLQHFFGSLAFQICIMPEISTHRVQRTVGS